MSYEPVPSRNFLLTGASGGGKSTLIMTVCERLRGRKIRGLFSQILWEGDQRNGWRLDTFDGDGDGGVLAHMDIHSQHNMGRYGVDMLLFERLVDSQSQFDSEVYVYLVDEIGFIAPGSPKFVFAMDELLDSSQKVIATIHVSGDGYVQQVNDSSDVGLWEVTHENREHMLDMVLDWIEKP